MNQEIEKMSMKEYREKICLFGSLAELHFKLMNILSFICYNAFRCFCEKHCCAEFEYNSGKQCCVLCHIPVQFYNFEEMLDKNQYNKKFLKKYLDYLLPFLIECYEVDKRLIECFIFGEFEYIFGDNYTGQKSSVLLSEQIKYQTYLKKINDSDRYFDFFN